MIIKLFVCLGICFVILLCSIAGAGKGMDFVDSKNSNEEMIGTVMTVASFIVLFASLVGVIIFTIKLFIFYLYGSV